MKGFLIVALICGAAFAKGPAAKSTASGDVVILHLERREDVITIKNTSSGVRYTVRKKDGTVVHENVTDQELQAKNPDLAQFVKSAMSESKSGAPAVDASLSK